MAIDIGHGAANGNDAITFGATIVDRTNSANATGILDVFQVWAYSDMSALKIGTFSGSGTSWNDRDYESIGSVTSGSTQTFTGKNCSVETGDIIGHISTGGQMETNNADGSGYGYASGDKFDTGANTYTFDYPTGWVATYATGIEAAGHPAIKRFGGIPFAAMNRGVW